jgi:hypothetical protein
LASSVVGRQGESCSASERAVQLQRHFTKWATAGEGTSVGSMVSLLDYGSRTRFIPKIKTDRRALSSLLS